MKIKHTIITVVVALFAMLALACGGASDGKGLAAPEPTLNGSTVSWKAVDGAEKYIVTVNGSQYNTTDTTYTVSVTAAGEYEIYVTAVKGDEKKTSKKLTYTHNATLAVPTLSLSGNVVTWTAIANATGYEVYINDELKTTVTDPRYVITEEEVGTYTVKVKATGGVGYNASALSDAVTFTVTDGGEDLIKLDAPVISLENRTVSWTAVENATAYKVYVDGVETATVTSGTKYDVTLRSEGEYEITVSAVAPSSNYLASDQSNTVTLTVAAFDMTKPVVAYIVGNGATAAYSETQGKLVQHGTYDDSGVDDDFTTRAWRLVKAGDYYKIKLSNGAYLTSAAGGTYAWYEAENNGDGQLWQIRSAANGGYYITNKAVGDYLFCADSDSDNIHFWGDADNDIQRWQMFNVEVTFRADMEVLDAPALEIDGTVVTWTAVENADEYKVYVNGTLVDTVTELTYTVQATAEGLYTVTVVATGDGYLDSRASDGVSYMHSTLDLAQPIYATYTATSGAVYAASCDDEGYVTLADASEITDFTDYMWYLEKDGEYYKIKFANGYYLTRVSNGDNGPEGRLMPANGGDNQLWKLVADGFNKYKLQNKEHMSQWGNSFYYGETNGIYKFLSSGLGWNFENKEISFGGIIKLAAPTVELNGDVASWSAVDNATGYEIYINGVKTATVTELTYTMQNSGDALRVKAVSTVDGVENSYLSNSVTYTNLFANPVVAYYSQNSGAKTLGVIGDDNTLVIGAEYTTVSDYSAYLWTFEKLENGNYMIKLADGRYLSYYDNPNSGDVAQTIAAQKDVNDEKQQWKLIADGDSGTKFKLENVHLSHYYQNVYLGEWWGVYKFNGGCNAWTFFNPENN